MNKIFKTAPLEAWEAATGILGFGAMEKITYEAVGRKQIVPGPDFIDLPMHIAQELHDAGQSCIPISPANAALSAFTVNMFTGGVDNAEIDNILQPANPYREDMYICGFEVLFVANEGCIACKIMLHDCNDSSGGSSDVGIILLFDCGNDGFSVAPLVMDVDYTWLYDYESITKLSHWLGYLWRGIQYRMTNRPELVRIKHSRFTKESVRSVKRKTSGHKQVVKVQRIITIIADDETSVPVTHGKHNITVPVWGVSGHWRTCKSGKRVWIRPYYKGEERGKQERYNPKEYRFTKEEVADA